MKAYGLLSRIFSVTAVCAFIALLFVYPLGAFLLWGIVWCWEGIETVILKKHNSFRRDSVFKPATRMVRKGHAAETYGKVELVFGIILIVAILLGLAGVFTHLFELWLCLVLLLHLVVGAILLPAEPEEPEN